MKLTGASDDVAYGATWFTELQGGSDLGANKVEAREDNGSWKLFGDTKYFASNAGLADYAIVTAKLPGGVDVKDLGLFLIPEINSSGGRNFSVRRLKEKSATRSVPTGEVEFNGSEAYLLGEAKKGIYYTMENLMVSRLSNAMGAVGTARKAYLETLFYSRKRSAFGKFLIEHPIYLQDLIKMEVLIEAASVLAFKAIHHFQRSSLSVPPYNNEYNYARVLTHLAKYFTADVASVVTSSAMEMHGGIGFLEEFPVERLHREALITPIWEGPSNIQALDLAEAVKKKGGGALLISDLNSMKGDIGNGKQVDLFDVAAENIRVRLSRMADYAPGEEAGLKDCMKSIAEDLSLCLLVHMSAVTGSERDMHVAKVFSNIISGRPVSEGLSEENIHEIVNIDI